jgi:hypothetical protein
MKRPKGVFGKSHLAALLRLALSVATRPGKLGWRVPGPLLSIILGLRDTIAHRTCLFPLHAFRPLQPELQ